jgi:hypothetical protein
MAWGLVVKIVCIPVFFFLILISPLLSSQDFLIEEGFQSPPQVIVPPTGNDDNPFISRNVSGFGSSSIPFFIAEGFRDLYDRDSLLSREWKWEHFGEFWVFWWQFFETNEAEFNKLVAELQEGSIQLRLRPTQSGQSLELAHRQPSGTIIIPLPFVKENLAEHSFSAEIETMRRFLDRTSLSSPITDSSMTASSSVTSSQPVATDDSKAPKGRCSD